MVHQRLNTCASTYVRAIVGPEYFSAAPRGLTYFYQEASPS
jgi:hypothetical protein